MRMADSILEDREKRYNYIRSLIEKYNLPVLCGKINYPGEDKNTKEADFAFLQMKEQVIEVFSKNMVYSEMLHGFDGKSFIAVISMGGAAAKISAVDIEENYSIGRVFDIDVYGLDGAPISRSHIRRKCRKCIICGKPARHCMREHAHDAAEIIEAVNLYINAKDGIP